MFPLWCHVCQRVAAAFRRKRCACSRVRARVNLIAQKQMLHRATKKTSSVLEIQNLNLLFFGFNFYEIKDKILNTFLTIQEKQ